MMKVIILVLLLSVVGFGQEPITGTGNLPYKTGTFFTGTTQEFWVCSACKGMFKSIKDRIAITCSNYHPKGCCHHWDIPYPLQMPGTGAIYYPIDVPLGTESTYLMPRLSITESQSGTVAIHEGNPVCLSYSESILSTELKEGNLEITKRSWCSPSSMNTVPCYPGPCDNIIRKAWKEIYTARAGKIVLLKTIKGMIVPAQNERIEWPKE